MRRYRVGVGGSTYVIDVDEVSAEEFKVTVGDRDFAVTLSSAEDVAEAVITPEIRQTSNGDRDAPVSAARFRPAPPEKLPSMVPSAPPPLPPTPDRVAATGRVVKAPMPGTITAVIVTPGAEVRTGDLLLKLEAMKMVNAIKSPRHGVVAEVTVQAGQSVGYGQPLVVFSEQ
jgi:biotin carboxyl carrier protein